MVKIHLIKDIDNTAYSDEELLSITSFIADSAVKELHGYLEENGGVPEDLYVTRCDKDRIGLSKDPDATSETADDFVIQTWNICKFEGEEEEEEEEENYHYYYDERHINVNWTFHCMGPEHSEMSCDGKGSIPIHSFDDYAASLSDEHFLKKMEDGLEESILDFTVDSYIDVDTSIMGINSLNRLRNLADTGNHEAAWLLYNAARSFQHEDEFTDEERLKHLDIAIKGCKDINRLRNLFAVQYDDCTRYFVGSETKALSAAKDVIQAAKANLSKNEISRIISCAREILSNWYTMYSKEPDVDFLDTDEDFFGYRLKAGHLPWQDEITEFMRSYPKDVLECLGDAVPEFRHKLAEGGEYDLYGYDEDEFLEWVEEDENNAVPIDYVELLKDRYGSDFAIEFLSLKNPYSYNSEGDDLEKLKKYAEEFDSAEVANKVPLVAMCSYDIIDVDMLCYYCAMAVKRGKDFWFTIFFQNILDGLFDDYDEDELFDLEEKLRKNGLEDYIPEVRERLK